MKTLAVFLLCFALAGYAQQKEMLRIQIDSVNVYNRNGIRNFTFFYRIQNLTDQPVSFYLIPGPIQPNASSSLSNRPFYRFYQEDQLIDIWGIFEPWNRPNPQGPMQIIDTTAVEEVVSFDNFIEERRKTLRDSRHTLAPKASLTFFGTLQWDGQRYFQHDDLEYYLDENKPHFIEIGINLLREELRENFTEADFATLLADPTLIRGWYMSNRVPLDFRP